MSDDIEMPDEQISNVDDAATREQFILELLATISHEFRTPLATIQGYADMLLRQEALLASEERRDFLLAIQEAGTRLASLME